MGQHCIICNFPCDDDVLFCPECVDADKFNERKAVNEEVRELHRLWEQDCERMNKEIDRLNNELEEKKRNETDNEKEKEEIKKLFPYSNDFKHHKKGYKKRLHKCPICGGSRRSGYYRICPKCDWVYEWQKKVEELVEQADAMMKEHDALLRVLFFKPYIANIDCEITAYCDQHEVTETHRNGDRLTGEFKVEYKARNFRTGINLSLVELRNAIDPKKILLDTVIELFRKAKESVESYIDRNGKMVTICGVPVPAVGASWGEPRRKDHAMFVRR